MKNRPGFTLIELITVISILAISVGLLIPDLQGTNHPMATEDAMIAFSTHVLDTARGRPAAGILVVLEKAGAGGEWQERSRGTTDADGRIKELAPKDKVLSPGDYRLRFATEAYFKALGEAVFYPEVLVQVRIPASGGRFHLPLLLSPYGYSTYRGS